MENVLLVTFIVVSSLVIYRVYRKSVRARRERLIDEFSFPNTIGKKVIEKYPHLNEQQARQIIGGLREYFHLCNIAGRKIVAMPSQAVDVAWHEFILFTRQYKSFCNKSLGRFLHHIPAEAMQSSTVAQASIKTAWKISCLREGIQPKSAHKLPLLFAMDAELNIPDGFRYSMNCKEPGGNAYCAGHIGCGSGCGGGGTGDSSGCGGGCGGD